MQITQEEVKKAVNNMGKTDILAASGIHLGGVKYM